jgi:Rrf2 family protein
MLRVSRKVEYALMALRHMAQKPNGALTSAREICQTYKTPFDTTAKVMQSMNLQGILTSVKGVKGGYSLSKDLNDISFSELTNVIEGKNIQMNCTDENGETCERYDGCAIRNPLYGLGSKLNEYLKDITIKELLFGDFTIIKQPLSHELAAKELA